MCPVVCNDAQDNKSCPSAEDTDLIMAPVQDLESYCSPEIIDQKNMLPNAQDNKCCPSTKKRGNRKTKKSNLTMSPHFIKVKDLHPGMENVYLTLKVINVKVDLTDKGKIPVTESLVGDETGTIIFRAIGRNKINRVREGSTIIVNRGKIHIFKGSMRLAVQKAKYIIEEEAIEPATLKEDCYRLRASSCLLIVVAVAIALLVLSYFNFNKTY